MPSKNQKRDKNGRFASKSGFAASRLAEFGKRAAIGAAGIGAGYAAARLISGASKSADTPTEAPPPTAPPRTAPHNRSISLGQGVRIKGQQVSTLERAADIAKANTRNHGITAHTADSLRTMKSLEKLALVERRSHPEGTAERSTRRPHYVATRQGVDALVKAGIWSAGDREKWTRARGRDG